MDLLTTSDAEFSACERYRYTLMRSWADGPTITYILLNPSTATAEEDDATVLRCRRRAIELGCGTMYVANLFALRSTDPEGLYEVDDPVGPDNDAAIQRLAVLADTVVCGWGNHGAHQDRGTAVLTMLRDAGITPHCLAVTGEGQPWHPLYLAYSLQPMPLPPEPIDDDLSPAPE